uniref:RHS repeat domain-containing protein n=1 Tax=Fodinicola feengrottensis TaxID=435914 RepID=UPI0036F1F99B
MTPTSVTSYDTRGLPTNTTDPLGAQTSYTYDPYGRPDHPDRRNAAPARLPRHHHRV